jgi:hypothetical protein
VHRQTQKKRDGGLTPPEKGKGGQDLSLGEYFIIFMEKCNVGYCFILSSWGWECVTKWI